MHLDEETVERVVDGELSPAADAAAREHVAGCESCGARVTAARHNSEFFVDLVREIDTPLRTIPVDSVIEAASARAARVQQIAPGAELRRKLNLRWAASLFIAIGAAGAAGYLIPGSPLPGVVKRFVQALSLSKTEIIPEPRSDSSSAVFGGIQATPGNNFTIAFAAAADGGEALVSFSDSAQISIRALQGEADFTSPNDSLISIGYKLAPPGAVPATAARFEIVIPRDAPRVEILVAGRRVFLAEHGIIAVDVAANARGGYTIPLTSRSPR